MKIPKKLRPTITLKPEEQKAWDVIVPKLLARGDLIPEYCTALTLLCTSYCDYLYARETLKMGVPGVEIHPEWEKVVEDHRIMTRKLAAEFNLIPVERIPLSLLDEENDDAELKAWFTFASDM